MHTVQIYGYVLLSSSDEAVSLSNSACCGRGPAEYGALMEWQLTGRSESLSNRICHMNCPRIELASALIYSNTVRGR
jgi:hypothetical protein